MKASGEITVADLDKWVRLLESQPQPEYFDLDLSWMLPDQVERYNAVIEYALTHGWKIKTKDGVVHEGIRED